MSTSIAKVQNSPTDKKMISSSKVPLPVQKISTFSESKCQDGEIKLTLDANVSKALSISYKTICVNKCLNGSKPTKLPVQNLSSGNFSDEANIVYKYMTSNSSNIKESPFLCMEPSGTSYSILNVDNTITSNILSQTCMHGVLDNQSLSNGIDTRCLYVPTFYPL